VFIKKWAVTYFKLLCKFRWASLSFRLPPPVSLRAHTHTDKQTNKQIYLTLKFTVVTCLSAYRRSFRLEIKFVDQLHDSELHEITAPPLIYTIHKSLQHRLSVFSTCSVATTTTSNSGDSLPSRAQVPSSRPPVQNWTQTNFVSCL
jgi:hypothetical protein